MEILASGTREKSPLQQQVESLSLLHGYRPTWLEYKDRYDRSLGSNPDLPSFGKPLDRQLAAEYKPVNDQMNRLLERYFSQKLGVTFEETTTGLAIALDSSTPHQPQANRPTGYEVPIKHTQLTYPAEADYDGA